MDPVSVKIGCKRKFEVKFDNYKLPCVLRFLANMLTLANSSLISVADSQEIILLCN